MLKNILCSLFLSAVLNIYALPQLFAAPQLINYENFLEMTPEEQEKLIILAMDYMVEAEKMTQYQTSNPTQKDLIEKYYSLLKIQIENLLIQSAYAEEPTKAKEKLKANLEAFSAILIAIEQTDARAACFYAG